MKTIKLIRLITSLITILAFSAVLYTSCSKPEENDPVVDTACLNVNCNNGDCVKGQCACYPGWEGVFCDIQTLSKYYGDWAVVETIASSNDTTNTNGVGDTMSYTFHVIPDGSSLLTFRIAGLMNKQNDTIKCTLGHPIDHFYERTRFYFEGTSLQNANVYLPGGAGKISSAGTVMDSLGYTRWYDGVNQFGDTFLLKETVLMAAQKAP